MTLEEHRAVLEESLALGLELPAPLEGLRLQRRRNQIAGQLRAYIGTFELPLEVRVDEATGAITLVDLET